MVSLFYARHPAGQEVKPDDHSVPYDTPVSVVNVNELSPTASDTMPSDVPPADGVPASSNDPNTTQTPTDLSPMVTNGTMLNDAALADGASVSSNDPNLAPMPTDLPPQPMGVPDPSPTPSDPPPTTSTTLVQNPPPPGSTTVPDQNPTNQDQRPPSSTPAPNPTLIPCLPPEEHTSTFVEGSGSPHCGTQEHGPSSLSPQPTQTDYFVPSSVLNRTRPMTSQTLGTDTTPAPSSTIVSTRDLPASSTVTLSTDMLQPTPTAVLTQGGALSTGSSSNKKYIIGGAVGGSVLLILLALLLFCCRKRRAKRDLERSDGGHSEGQPWYGQFACCDHGTCNRNNGQPQTEQKTPLKPFILKSESAAITPKEGQQQRAVSLGRRDSTESQKSAGSDASAGSLYSSDSEGSQRGKRRSQKRPPPLKLTSLVTPVINGLQNDPRSRVGRSSLPNPHGVPTIIVEPPQSETPDRMRRH